jgi:phage recombination protein Bet
MNAVTTKPKLLETMAIRLGVEAENMLRILKNTVIKPQRSGKEATNEEVQAFLIVANKYDLNPLTREIYAFENNGAIIPIVSIDGWATLVNRNENFDGCDFETETDADGKVFAITCKIYDKRRSRPIAVTEYLSECSRKSIPWGTMPHRMLRHKAFIQAARLAFGLSGIYDEDEATDITKNRAEELQTQDSQKLAKPMDRLRAKLLPQSPAKEQAPQAEPSQELVVEPEEARPAIQPEQATMFPDEPEDVGQSFLRLLKMSKSKTGVLDIGKRLCTENPQHVELLGQLMERVINELEG